MHPAVAVRQLEGLERAIAEVLAEHPEGMAQVEVAHRLETIARVRSVAQSVGQSTLSRAMSRLIAAGLVERNGRTRASRYQLEARALWAITPSIRRAAVSPDARIERYEVNVTRWLPDHVAALFHAQGASARHSLDATTYSRQIAERFLIDLSWASSALEGNTYDQLDTEVLVKYGEQARGHDLVEATMILDHKRAITSLLHRVGEPTLDASWAARFHALLMRDLLDPANLGRVRDHQVLIGGSSYRPSDDPIFLSTNLGALLWKAEQVEDPYEASFLLLAGLSYLQAFSDGNKRLGRLMCNIPLLWRGLPPISFVGVDKSAYITGMVLFYEHGDAELLASAIADGYASSAPAFAAAMTAHRIPRQIELRERRRIGAILASWVDSAATGGAVDLDMLVRRDGADLAESDRAALLQSLQEVLNGLSVANAGAWELDETKVEAALRRRRRASGDGQLDLFEP